MQSQALETPRTKSIHSEYWGLTFGIVSPKSKQMHFQEATYKIYAVSSR